MTIFKSMRKRSSNKNTPITQHKFKKAKKVKKTAKKHVNSTPSEAFGIKFRSQHEVKFYTKYMESGIGFPIAYEKKTFVLQEQFEYEGKKVNSVTAKPDFIITLPNGFKIVCEIKGRSTPVFDLKIRYIKKYFKERENEYKYVVLYTIKDMDNFINTLILYKSQAA
jgi:uncharacterized protein YlzI (FlbEa/FlbD family)